ncbi:MAG TPA: SDR family oxidoreductase [Candidatus Xenobia bacterium]|nr:SDR family oxidoreductase [Candidatus Xenobia bacterium]
MDSSHNIVFWRVEGSLVSLNATRPVAFFTWNAHTFAERWVRRSLLGVLIFLRPFLYLIHRVGATRALHALLRGVSRDRLDLLGEEYFHYYLKSRLDPKSVEKLRAARAGGAEVVLVGQALDHILRPMAEHLGVARLIANRLEFRDGHATGRLLDPVIRPRSILAWFVSRRPDGRVSAEKLISALGFADEKELMNAIVPAQRRLSRSRPALVRFNGRRSLEPLSVRRALAGKHILLIGVTGFIGKVWLVKLLMDLPEVGKVYLLVRGKRSQPAVRRFEKIVEESPVFEPLHERHGSGLGEFLRQRIEVVEGDVAKPGLGLAADVQARLREQIDLIVNSSGLTDFNPTLPDALGTNVDAVLHILDFQRQCRRAALLHLSTCYVVGARDGRVPEELEPDYTPARVPGFDAEREWQALHGEVRRIQARAESAEVSEELRAEVRKRTKGKALAGEELENHVRRYRGRWLRNALTEAGVKRARELGWPNTYTLTKSLAESLIARRGADLPVAVVRPSIVETSVREPFLGWNEGINTSAPLSHLLGTYFRQLPSNERKCLDLIPVDVVCRGMVLVAAALVERRHERLYQLATSAVNPCDMRRSIELTALAHRKHYRALEGLHFFLRSRFDTIPVSKARYQALSAPAQRALIQAINRTTTLVLRKPPFEKKERELVRIEKLIELYEPFILHNEHVFETQNVALLSALLPPEERDAFSYEPHAIDWWDYWINIHVPALRRWVYPLIEGRPLETRPRRPLQPPLESQPAEADSQGVTL